LVLIAERQTMFVTKTSIGIGILSCVCMYFSVKFFGPVGALYVLNIASLLLLFIYIIRVKRIVGVIFNNFLFIGYLFISVSLLIFRNSVFNNVLVMEEFLILVTTYVLISIPIILTFYKNVDFFLKKQVEL
jgi:hypothetical protein